MIHSQIVHAFSTNQYEKYSLNHLNKYEQEYHKK